MLKGLLFFPRVIVFCTPSPFFFFFLLFLGDPTSFSYSEDSDSSSFSSFTSFFYSDGLLDSDGLDSTFYLGPEDS